MSGIQANFINLIYFTGRLAPILLVFFFTLSSIINTDWRGVIYLSGIILSCFIAILTSNTLINSKNDTNNIQQEYLCSFTDQPFSYIPLSSVTIGFTVMYLILPMIKTYNKINNILLLFLFIIFISVDVFFLVNKKCSMMKIITDENSNLFILNSLIPILIAYFIGFFVGQIYVIMLNSTGNGSLLYYNSQTIKPLCDVEKSNKFTCKVYKNGELIYN